MILTPVILCGGAGERLWPLSKFDYPKQFVVFEPGAPSLFQQAVMRVADRAHFTAPIVVCNDAHRFIVYEQLRAQGILDAEVVVEPFSRNTAPALALAALHAAVTDPDRLLLVLPSDHRIIDNAAFLAAVTVGSSAATKGAIVTFGIVPDAAETGYGYIEYGNVLPQEKTTNLRGITRFIEKPSQAVAEGLLTAGNVVINSGIFLLSATTALDALAQHAPLILSATRRAYGLAVAREQSIFPDAACFESSPSDSIDYAIMEHTDRGAVLPVSMGWSDLGSFTALAAITAQDHRQNTQRGNIVLHDASNCYLHSDGPLVAALGVEDLLVVAADNAVLVMHKNRTQDIKPLLQQLRTNRLPDINLTSFAHRPWGNFTRIDHGPRYQVKRLHVKPGANISLQTHQHRSEHWIVIEGRATVTHGESTRILEKNQSTYIPAGAVHRLENREGTELVVIEVQTGDYLGEDDIVRLEDSYHRS